MGIKPVMVSTLSVREVWKASVIYKATLHYIFLSSLREYKRKALLKDYKRKPYSAIGRIHIFYRSYFYWESSSLVEFPSISIYLTIDST